MIPRRSSSFTGHFPVRIEGAPGGPLEGDAKWRSVPNFENGTLCRAFGLDPVRFHFDVASSVHGVGSRMVGAGGNGWTRKGPIGVVFMNGQEVGKLAIAYDSERFADRDPLDRRDFFDFSRS